MDTTVACYDIPKAVYGSTWIPLMKPSSLNYGKYAGKSADVKDKDEKP